MFTTFSAAALIMRAFAFVFLLSTITSAVSVPHKLPRKDWIPRETNYKRQAAMRSPEVPLPRVARMPNASNKCTNPRIRKEWRRLTDDEKKNYIDAVHCMKKSPPKFNTYFPGIKNRYDDFVAYHINATSMLPGTHNNGYFLPFHRYLIWNWENVLQEECGLKLSGLPYWDWSLDTPERNGTFEKSPVFDSVLGFGGDGRHLDRNSPDGPRCIESGPFAQYRISLTYRNMQDPEERCLERDFRLSLAEKSSSWSKVLKPSLEQDNYEDFSELDFAPGPFTREKGGPHTIGHMGVGGEMANLFSSTNDPLFFIHHGGIDHFWFLWQGRNKTRFRDIKRSVIDFHRLNEPVPPERGPEGITTMDTPIFQTGEFAPLAQISQVMDTINEDRTGFLCYIYDSKFVDFRGTPVAKALPNGGAPDPSAYPEVPALQTPLKPWSGILPEDGGGFDLDMDSNRTMADQGHHHHDTSASSSASSSSSSSVAPTTSVLAVVTPEPMSIEIPEPTLITPSPEPTVEVSLTKAKKSEASNYDQESFLAVGAQSGSDLRSSTSSPLSDPQMQPASQPNLVPLPEWQPQQQTQDRKQSSWTQQSIWDAQRQQQQQQQQQQKQQANWGYLNQPQPSQNFDTQWQQQQQPWDARIQPQAPPYGYAPSELIDSGLIPLPSWTPGQQDQFVEDWDDEVDWQRPQQQQAEVQVLPDITNTGYNW